MFVSVTLWENVVVSILSHLDSSCFEMNLSSETAQKFQKVCDQEEHMT